MDDEDIMLLKQLIYILVVKLSAFVCPKLLGHTLLEHRLKGIPHRHPLLVFEWYQPAIFGEDIDDAQDELISLIVPRKGTHINKVGRPGLIHTTHYHTAFLKPVRGRHNNVDCFYLCQNYFKLPRQTIRENANFICLFQQDAKNLDHIRRDHCNDLTKEQFDALCKHCWSQPYGFVTIDLTSPKSAGKYRCKLEEFYVN